MKSLGVKLPRANKRLISLYNSTINLTDNQDIVTDVGADHGYLAVMLKKSGLFKKVIATDISAPSLQKTTDLAKQLNLDIETRVGDGLLVAPETTLACICGMGGYEIIKILQQPIACKKFVLQPVQNIVELREYLLTNKYKITEDYLLQDKGKYYYIIAVNGSGKNKYNFAEKYFGKNYLQNKDICSYIQTQINKLKFLENFDIKSVDKTQIRQIKQKIKFYKLCKKIINKGNIL